MSAVGSVLQAGRVAFEVSRFEIVGDSCRVEGQWFGVRGRRFMRPALTVVVHGRPIRLLADLADKPWAAEDGEPWRARFPYSLEGEQPDVAELTVSPDVTITLPAPDRRATSGRRKAGSRRAHAPQQEAARPVGTPVLLRELTDLRDRERHLRARLERVEADRTEITQRLLAASGELREVLQEREASNAVRDRLATELEAVQQERSELVAERDAALQERDLIAAERDAVRRGQDETVRASETAGVARDRALAERDAALEAQRRVASERDAAVADRDQAIADLDAAESLRDEALAARDAAVWDREAVSRTAEQLQAELSELYSAHGAALVMRRATPATGIGGHGRSIFLRGRPRSGLIPGAITIVIVLVVLAIWVILLRGL